MGLNSNSLRGEIMLGKLFECEADKNKKYYRVIQTIIEYKDGKKFPIDEVVVSDKKLI